MAAVDPDWTDVKLLRLLDVLYRRRSVSRAAEDLGVSQPTVSIWLAKLRDRHGDPLYVRTPEGMLPTPRMDGMIDDTRAALEALRRLADHGSPFEPGTSSRRFRICMTDASHITLLPRILRAVRSEAPSVELEAARIDPGTADALRSGEADLAIGLVPGLEAGFYQQTLFDQDWVCLVGRHHPRIVDRLTLADWENEQHIGIVQGTGQTILEEAIRGQGIRRRVMLRLPGFLGLAAVLAMSDLVATLPRHIGETLATFGDLSVFDTPFPIPGFSVKQHWHVRYHHDDANRWLRETCARLFMGGRGPTVRTSTAD